jgi:hypothetical protein
MALVAAVLEGVLCWFSASVRQTRCSQQESRSRAVLQRQALVDCCKCTPNVR